MTRNKMSDLTNHLFEQIERLKDDNLTEEELDREIERSDAIQKLAKPIIDIAELSFRAKVKQAEYHGLDDKKGFLIE